jgi:hypothetical protein
MNRLKRSNRFLSRRRSGMAYILVMVALAVCMLLGTAFLLNASRTSAIGQYSADRLNARLIAEAGLAMGTRYVELDPAWRKKRPNGQWINDYKILGGSFSLWGQDGEAIDSTTGQVIGDGSLGDSESDPLVLTAVGTYGSSKYRVRRIVRVAGIPSIAVETTIELKGDSVVDSYSAAAGPYGGANVGAAARISSNDNGKENVLLSKSARINGTLYFPAGGDPTQAVKITESAVITGGYGSMLSEGINIDDIEEPTYTASNNNATYNSTTTIGAANTDTTVAYKNLTINGSGKVNIAGNVTMVVDSDFLMANSGRISLDNPKFGNTAPFNKTGTTVAFQQLATPIVVTKKVAVRKIAAFVSRNSKKIRMAIYSDAAGAPGTLIVQSAVETMTSDSFYWHEAYVDETVLNPGAYWLALAFNDDSAGYRYDPTPAAVIKAGDAITGNFGGTWGVAVPPATPQTLNMYLTGNVEGEGATLKIYTRGTCTIQDDAVINRSSAMASRCTMYNLDPLTTAETKFKGNSLAYVTACGPDALLHVQERAQLYGKARVAKLLAEGQGAIHVDTSEGIAPPGYLIDKAITLKDTATVNGMTGNAIIACNAIGTPVIWLRERSTLRGDGYGGPGGAGGNVGYNVKNSDIRKDTAATMTGDVHNLKEAVDLSNSPAPLGLPLSGDVKYSNGLRVIDSSFACKSLTFDRKVDVEVDGKVVIVVNAGGDVRFVADSQLRLRPGASLTIYCSNVLEARDRVKINDGGDPAKLIIEYSGNSNVVARNTASFCGTLRAPSAQVEIKESAQFYGRCYALRFISEKFAKVHCDSSGSNRSEWVEGR